MRVVGIIAEYNPFHYGHAYHIQKAKEETQADYVIAVMSGDFVQRGTPAIFDKYLRTEMALRGGADLVLELPNAFATSSAEDFATCGTALFDKLGIVSHLCFGSEHGEIAPFTILASWLAKEHTQYSMRLQHYLKEGYSYPASRELAVSECMKYMTSDTMSFVDNASPDCLSKKGIQVEELSNLLNNPNNILALEYCKALFKRNSSIQPVTIQREGMGYHESFSEPNSTVSPFSEQQTADASNDCDHAPLFHSATSIRQLLTAVDTQNLQQNAQTIQNTQTIQSTQTIQNIQTIQDKQNMQHKYNMQDNPNIVDNAKEANILLQQAVPAGTFSCFSKGHPIFLNDLSPYLNYALLTAFHQKDTLCRYADVSSELQERLQHHLLNPVSFEERIFQLKTKQYTYTRISRALLHILLQIQEDSMRLWKSSAVDFAPYARILGFQAKSAPLLRELKRHASIPLITRPKEAKTKLSAEALSLFEQDIFASHLYQSIIQSKYHIPAKNEYQAGRELLGFTE